MNITNDIINGIFELAGSIFIFYHCFILYKDKVVKGVSITSTMYFFMWGVWNLVYYPSLTQWYSFYGEVMITISNVVWIGMMLYYRIKSKVKP